MVIAEARTPRDGKFIETIGHYNPQAEPAEFVVKADRVQHWMQNGAKLTETVERLLRRQRLDRNQSAGRRGLGGDDRERGVVEWPSRNS